MSIAVLVRQGNSADPADDADITDDTPIFDDTQSLISLGGQWEDGEAGTGDIVVEDYTGTTFADGGGKVLGSGCLVTATEDAAGCPYWWFRGRKYGHAQGRGARKGGNAAEWQVHTYDGNIELTDLYLTEDWPRGVETGYQRLVALQAYLLNGPDSTAPHHRDTCLIAVSDSHLCKNSNSQTLPAKTYTIGQSAREIVEDCAMVEGKDYGVVRHHAPFQPGGGAVVLESWTWDGGSGTPDPTWRLHAAHAADGADHNLGGTYGIPATDFYHSSPGSMYSQVGGAAFLPMCAAPGDVITVDGWFKPYADTCELRIFWFSNTAGTAPISNEVLSGTYGTGAFSHASGTSSPAPAGTQSFVISGLVKTSDGTIKTGWSDDVTVSGYATNSACAGGTTSSDCTHLCLEYIVPEDITTYVSTVKISDQRADWDPDNLTGPVFEPIWNQGAATTGDPSDLGSAIISRWGPNQAAIFIEDTGRTLRNDFHAFVYDDSDSVNATEAALRANAILSTRTLEHYSHAPSIIMRADQIHLITEGMLVEIKAAAAQQSSLGEYVKRRVAAVTYQPLSPSLMHRLTGSLVAGYMVSLNLDRLRGKGRLGRGAPQTEALTPHSADELPYTAPPGSPSTATNVQDELDFLQSEIDAIGPITGALTNTLGEQHVVKTVADAGSAQTLDLADANVFELTLTQDCTITATGFTDGKWCEGSVIVHQDSTGGWVLSYDAAFEFPSSGNELDTTADTTSGFGFGSLDGGTTIYWDALGAAGAMALDDLTDVTITSPTLADRLRFNGTVWANSNMRWEPHVSYDGTVVLDGNEDPVMQEVNAY